MDALKKVWGIGQKVAEQLVDAGCKSVAELRSRPDLMDKLHLRPGTRACINLHEELLEPAYLHLLTYLLTGTRACIDLHEELLEPVGRDEMHAVYERIAQ